MNYEQKYKKALEKAKNELQTCGSKDCDAARQIIRFFPELQESENEKIKRIIHSISNKISFHLHDIFTEEEFQCFDAWSNVWLKKQGNNVNIDIESMVSQYKQRLKSQGGVENTPIVDMCLTAFRHGVENVLEELSLKPESKEVTCTQEVETGNGNIKALVTEKLDSINKSTEDDVRRRSTIWILEYARGLDTFNQYVKENIDKDIAWLEKQGIYKEWTNNDYDKIKSIEYLLHEFDNHNFDDWFNSLKRIEEQQ